MMRRKNRRTGKRGKGIAAAALSFVILAASFAAAEKECAPKRVRAAPCVKCAAPAAESLQPDEPVWDEVVSVFSEGFEYQEAKIYINGAAYPGLNYYYEGELYVLPSEYVPEFISGCSVDDDGARAASCTEGFDFEAAAGDMYFSLNGRCFFCEHGVLSRGGAVALPLSVLSSALGVELKMSGDDRFAAGDASPAVCAEEFYDADDLFWLSRIISCESMSESLLGKIAVGNVVLNRVASDDFPSDVEGVVFDSRYGVVQFSPVSGGHIFNDPDPESVVAAKLCLEGVSLSDKILYFMNPSIATSSWISDNRDAVMTIGHHTFYS